MPHSEQKCAHFYSEWCVVGYETGALWDLWDWPILTSYKSGFLGINSGGSWIEVHLQISSEKCRPLGSALDVTMSEDSHWDIICNTSDHDFRWTSRPFHSLHAQHTLTALSFGLCNGLSWAFVPLCTQEIVTGHISTHILQIIQNAPRLNCPRSILRSVSYKKW